ncbi:MAG: FAD-dependent oxidoreductase [Alphaproteobacteria bacterium]|nr:FAD-dependent oxidoreductase [Alphaproteobacteria bacterium]
MSARETVAVIGAGAVGACAALALQRRGFAVTLIDRDAPGSGASYGNAGFLSASSIIPVATPGILGRVPKMLRDPLSPLTIRWSYLPFLLPWLARFVRASRPEEVERIAAALVPLILACRDDWRAAVGEDAYRALVRSTGILTIFKSDAAFARAQWAWELRRRHGIPFEILEGAALRQQEPALTPDVKAGIFVPQGAHAIDPQALVQAAAAQFEAAGGMVRRGAVARVAKASDGRPAPIIDGAAVPFDRLVIAAGAHSRPLARQCGIDVPLDTERGYHVMLPRPGVMPRLPMLSGDHDFGITPMAKGLRIAGTVELGGLNAAPNWARAQQLLRMTEPYLGRIDASGAETWLGFRPSMPDSLPVIGRVPGNERVILAFGHGHLGLSLGAVTGAMVAALAAGETPAIDPTPYRPERFA